MESSLFLSDLHSAHERGRASPSRRAARRAWNTSDSVRWGQARPTVRGRKNVEPKLSAPA
ncbi:MAG: hypothetical protein FJ398_21420 [Verrucomicrobia bacterium]|nr:hypothetical protein [Verrucomicrobiota bacterium]